MSQILWKRALGAVIIVGLETGSWMVQAGSGLPKLRIETFQGGELRKIVIDDVGVGRMLFQEILVIVFCRVKDIEGKDHGGDGSLEQA